MSGSYTDPFAQASQALGYNQPNTPLPMGQVPAPQAPGGLPSDQPGFLGVAPSVWQNIGAMGAGMVQGANQRTADGHLANGTGIAGGMAGAAQGLIANQLGQARARSEYGLQSEQTQGLHLQNQLNAVTMPYQAKLAQFRAAMMDPGFMRNYMQQMQGIYGGQGNAPMDFSGGGGGVSYGDSVLSKEGYGQNPNSTANGWGQLIHDQKAAFAQAHPEYFQGAKSLDEPFKTYAIGKAATDWIASTQSAPVLSSAGVPITGPNLAMAHRLGPSPAVAVIKSSDDTPLPQALAQALPPDQVASYVKANPEFAKQTVGQFRQKFADTPSYGPAQAQYQPGQQGGGAGGGGGFASPNVSMQAQQRAQQLRQQAQTFEVMRSAGAVGVPDPADLRQQAQALDKLGYAQPEAAQSAQGKADVERNTAGPIAYNTAQGKSLSDFQMLPEIERMKAWRQLQVKPESDRNGNWIIAGKQPGEFVNLGKSPQIGNVWNEGTGNNEHGDMGATGMFALPPGQSYGPSDITGAPAPKNAIAGPGPGKKEYIEAAPEVTRGFINHDAKMINEDLAHVIDNVTPAKQQLFQLRSLNPDANTGAAGELRMEFKNWVQTFAPDFVGKIVGDASPMQEFKKIALMGAGKQERGDLGARGGFRAMELYMSANPNLDNQPEANRHMANALLVSHQYHEDYARGASSFYNGQITAMDQRRTAQGYQPLSKYDPEYSKIMRPELYAKAIEAMNGKPSSVWGKDISVAQARIIGGIILRTDPTAVVDVNGKQAPATDFSDTFGPEDVKPGSSGGH